MADLPPEGRARAVIDAVHPSVDGGRFAVKRIVGDPFTVEAHCFTDGHDALRVLLRWRREAEGDWHEIEMEPLGNDRWRGSFRLDSAGRAHPPVLPGRRRGCPSPSRRILSRRCSGSPASARRAARRARSSAAAAA